MPKLQNLLKRRLPPLDPVEEEESRARLEARLATLVAPGGAPRNGHLPEPEPADPGDADAAAGLFVTSTSASDSPPSILVLAAPSSLEVAEPDTTDDAASTLDATEGPDIEAPAPAATSVVIVEDDWDTPAPGDDAAAQAGTDVDHEPSLDGPIATEASAAPEAVENGVAAAPVATDLADPPPGVSPAASIPDAAAADVPTSKPSALLGFIRSGGRRRPRGSAKAADAAPATAAPAADIAPAPEPAPEPATRARPSRRAASVGTPRAAGAKLTVARVEPTRAAAPKAARTRPGAKPGSDAKPTPTRAARVAARPAPVGAKRAAPVGARRTAASKATASCPYCAEPLAVPPVASGRCPRCRQRIVVRKVGDRAVLLTEAALPVFLAERRRAVHAGPWMRARDRWLALAVEAKALPDRVARIQRDPISEAAVSAARNLYVSTVEQAARQARRERRWDLASRLSLELGATLYRMARSPRPVPADALAAHREGLGSALRGIAEIAKSAELRAGACCSTCADDDGRVVRISEELRAATLPHEACPKGLCRCRWSLADRDRAIVSSLLRRQTRPARRTTGAAG